MELQDKTTLVQPTTLSRNMVDLGVVCPMANEGDESVRFCREVLEVCSGFRTITFFAVFDRSNKDSSWDQMRELERTEDRLRVIWAPENSCVADAYLRGYMEALDAGCDWILEIDAGFSHQPLEIPQFFDAMELGMDCVFGSRSLGCFKSTSVRRRVISWSGTFLSNLLLGTKLTDMTSGFEMFSREALSFVINKGVRSRAHFFQTEIKTYCRNMRIIEVPITYRAASPRVGSAELVDAIGQLRRLFQLRLKGQL
jgi:dolichol-phosphate mannosyltransferase